MYTIKHAAELTGLPEATLRAWERRYRVVVPLRTEGGYRLYDDGALAALRAMRDLVADGWSARQAADRVRSQVPPASGPAPAPADAAIDGSPDGRLEVRPTVRRRRHGRRHGLPSAAADLNPARLAAILDDRFSRGSSRRSSTSG